MPAPKDRIHSMAPAVRLRKTIKYCKEVNEPVTWEVAVLEHRSNRGGSGLDLQREGDEPSQCFSADRCGVMTRHGASETYDWSKCPYHRQFKGN